MLEALAERNLADTREAEEDLPAALTHLRRCRALAQKGRNAALDADACRRLSSVYAEIAAANGGGGGGVGRDGPVERESGEGGSEGEPTEMGDGGADPLEDRSENGLPEAEVRHCCLDLRTGQGRGWVMTEFDKEPACLGTTRSIQRESASRSRARGIVESAFDLEHPSLVVPCIL